MIEIGTGLSLEKNPMSAAEEAVRLAKIDLGEGKIDLAIAFSSVDLSSHILVDTLNSYLEKTPIVGCSTAAIISEKGIFKHGLSLMLLRLPPGLYFNIASVKGISAKGSLNAGRELGEKLLYGFKDIPRDLSIIFSDGLINEGYNLISGLQEKLGKSFPLVGAAASDHLRFVKTYLYFNREIFSDGAIGMLWGGKLNFGLGVKHGWKPLGKPRIITKSEGSVVYAIDGQAAYKIYEEYLAKSYSGLQKEIKRLSVLYPIGIYLPGEEEYLLRNVLSLDNDGALRFQGNVPAGSTIRLMIGTKESCLDATSQAILEAKKALTGKTTSAIQARTSNFVLIFNSASRYTLLKRDSVKELESIKKSFDDNTPIMGIYTYGEQAPLRAVSYQGQSYFHNQTVTILNIGG